MSFIPSLTPALNNVEIVTEPTENAKTETLSERLEEMDILLDGELGKQVKWEDYTFMDFCERGCGAQAPDGTITAFTRCVEKNNQILDLNVFTSLDNNLFIIDNASLNTITTGTGTVASKSSTELKKIGISSIGIYGNGQPLLSLSEFLATFKEENCLISIEPKDVASLSRILGYFEALNVPKDKMLFNVFLSNQTFIDFVLRAKALGYRVAPVFGGTGNTTTVANNINTAFAIGADYIVTGLSQTDVVLGMYLSCGIPTVVFNVARRWDRNRAISLGFKGCLNTSVEYVSRTTPISFTDTWKNKEYMVGMLSWNNDYLNANEMGDISNNGQWGWGSLPSNRPDGQTLHVTLQGWASPLTYNMGSNLTINIYYSMVTTASSDPNNWGGVYLHLGDMGDRQVIDHTVNNTSYEDFYLFLQRYSGQQAIFSRTSTGVTTIDMAWATEGPQTFNTVFHYRIAWSATKCRFSKLFNPHENSAMWEKNITHSKGLPDYFSFGNRGQALRFSNVLITHQATQPW